MTSREKIQAVIDEMGKVVIGQERLINRLLVGLFTGGHVLLEGVPGLAKTLTINTLAKILDLHFHRIQFTPDLLPAEFEVKKGPIFAQIILADEINRAPAKVQSALLEAMAEKQVTIGDTTYPLDKPFLVLATQNPVEQEGTFPLPEAQVDRFMLKVFLNYLDKDQELAVMRQKSNMDFNYEPKTVLNAEDIAKIRKEINEITISETLEKYIIELVFATRNPAEYGLTQEAGYIQFGASPRASIQLNLAAKVMAYLEGRDYVLPEDIKEMAPDILNHRIILNYVAEADNITTLQIIQSILSSVAINR
jgi:MoxR-like ATPase